MASTYTDILVHVVFATKGRKPTLTADGLHAYIGGIVKRLSAVPVAVGGVKDHVHMLVAIRATQNIADLVREVKKGASAWLKEQGSPVRWQEGYGAFSVGRFEKQSVVGYINSQVKHHRKESSADELRRVLRECGIEYDPQFFE